MSILTTKISNRVGLEQKRKQYDTRRSLLFHPKSDQIISGKTLQRYRTLFGKKEQSFAKKLSTLFDKKITLTRIEEKSTFHVLFSLQIGEERYILKANALTKKYIDFSFFLEAFIQRRLQNKEIPSLEFVFDFSRNILPIDYAIMQFAKGKNLDSYEGRNIKSIYYNLGEVFRKIHEIKGGNAGMISIERLFKEKKLSGISLDWREFFYTNLDLHLKKTLALRVLQSQDVALIKQLSKKFIQNPKEKLSLLHNDPGTRNIFTDGTSITAILDWEDAIIGDPLWEIAFIHTFLYRKQDAIRFHAFCRGYGITPNALAKNPLYWLYYTRIALLKTISRNREGYYNRQGFLIDKQRVGIGLQNLKKI